MTPSRRPALFRTRAIPAFMLTAAIGLGLPIQPTRCLADEPVAGDAATLDRSTHRVMEDRANTFTEGMQGNSSLAADAQGRFLVVWNNQRVEEGQYGIFAQRFDQLGRRIGTEVRLNEFDRSNQQSPAAAFDADGHAWVVWQSFGQDGDGDGIVLRRFEEEPDGHLEAMLGDAIVNDVTAGDQFAPCISISDAGSTLVTWSSADTAGHAAALGRIYSKDGRPAGPSFVVADDAGAVARNVTQAALPGGRFLVAWTHSDAATHDATLHGRIFDGNGQADGQPFTIAAGINEHDSIEPALAVDASGRFAVAWMQANSSEGFDVMMRQFSSQGEAVGEPVMVQQRDSQSWLNGAAIAATADGRFLVAWNEVGEKEFEKTDDEVEVIHPTSIMAQNFDAAGARVGETFRINREDEGEHALAAASGATRLIWTTQNQLAAAWNGGDEDEGDLTGVGLTVWSPRTLNPPAPARVAPLAAVNEDQAESAEPIRDPNWKPVERDAFVQSRGPDYGFLGYMTTEWQPPDPDIAAGPNHVVIVVNMRVAVFTHDGQEVFHEYLEDFFRDQGSNNFVFDPVAAWDPFARRFVIAAAEHNGNISRLVIAVSKTENPLDGWNKYGFNTNNIGDFIDFENLGISTDAYYITADYFGGQGNVIHIFAKAPMLVGDPVTLKWLNTDPNLLSLASVQTFDANAPAQYFATSWVSRTAIRIFGVRDATGAPTLVSRDLTVPTMNDPPDAAQRGSSNRLPTIDRRIKNGVYRNGDLWLSHTISEDNTARVRWYQITMNGWPNSGQNPSLTQMGTINNGEGQYNWFPDIGVSAEGDVVITSSRSSSNDYPYIARHIHKVGDATGAMREPVRLMESDGPHTGSRWGDYSGIDEDPDRPGVFWSHNEYNTTGTSWRTWVGEINARRGIVLSVDQIVHGFPSTLTVTNAGAGSTVYFGYSLAGTGTVHIGSLDVDLGIRNAHLIGTRTADATGTATISMNVPNNAPRIPVWLQAAEIRNTSNVIAGQIN